jgi:ATP-dependent exoDNAse (exonuclease V) beta subunit
MSAGILHIYNASAGSGKTYTLTQTYLRLAFSAPDAYRQILAVTFTNKATDEMKMRILKSLYDLKEGNPSDYAEMLMQTHQLDATRLRQRAAIILSDILQNYSYFSVLTIDTFFQKILRSFTREMNLGAGYEVELDTNKVIDEIVRNTIQSIETDQHLEKWLTEMAINRIENSKSWSITEELQSQGKEIFNESFLKLNFHQFSDEELNKNLNEINRKAAEAMRGFSDKIIEISTKALQIIAAHGLTYEDFSNKSRSFARQFVKWKSGNYEPPTDSFYNAIGDVKKWYSKSSDPAVISAIESTYDAGLNACMQEISELFDTEYARYESGRAIRKNIYVFGIYRHLLRELQNYREEHNVLLLSDANLFLRELIGADETNFIYEKIGSRFRHYLIDEFQDTSGFQWDNFKPLLVDAADQGHENMLVGDVKQSIYRWRGGRRELLMGEAAAAFRQFKNFTLDTNWRSARNIVEFNNQLYTHLPDFLFLNFWNSDQILPKAVEAGIDRIKQVFKDGKQKWQGKYEGGYVNIKFYSSKDDKNGEIFEKELISRIKDVQDRGYKASDICLLVRSNNEASGLAEILKQQPGDGHYNFRFISSESGFITSSPAVRFLLGWLRWIDNPRNEINNADLLKIYTQIIQHPSEIDWHELFSKAFDEEGFLKVFGNEFSQKINRIRQATPFQMVEDLIAHFQLHEMPDEVPYLSAFQDFVLEKSPKAYHDLNVLLREWDERGAETSLKLSEAVDAIKIYTIHKSKGLEFEVVMIPMLNGIGLDGISLSNFWASTKNTDFEDFSFFPLQYTSSLAESQFAEAYAAEKLSYYIDNLNMLYVATTRAKMELYILSDAKKKKVTDISSPVHQILTMASQNEKLNYFASTVENDLPEFVIGERLSVSKGNKIEPQIELAHEYVVTPPDKLPTLRKSTLQDYSDENIHYGRLIHSIFSSIKIVADLDKALDHALKYAHIAPDELPEIKNTIQKILDDSTVKEWFSSKWKVRTERKFISAGGMVRVPDRVIYSERECKVIDFKTGVHRPENEKQVRDYMNLLRDAGFEQVEGWLLYTDEVKTIKID